jgi:NADPH2:quinone reductase
VLLKNVSIIGIYWGSYISAPQCLFRSTRLNSTHPTENDPKRAREIWAELLAMFASGRLQPAVYRGYYTLDTLTQALGDLEGRKTWGKVVVRIREPAVRGKL